MAPPAQREPSTLGSRCYVAEQRALEKAGFLREGIARHAQFRAGQWRDLVVYSRLRSDNSPL